MYYEELYKKDCSRLNLNYDREGKRMKILNEWEIDPSLKELRKKAQNKVLIDLINALLYENFLNLREKGIIVKSLPQAGQIPLADEECWFTFSLNQKQMLTFRVLPKKKFQSYEISRLPVLLVENDGQPKSLEAVEVMNLLNKTVPHNTFPNIEGFCEELQLSIEQTALSFEEPIQLKIDSCYVDLIEGERFAALRDRPFHPTSRVKNGWNKEEYRIYSSEFGKVFGLDWIAIHKKYIRQGNNSIEHLPQLLLSPFEQERLRRSIEENGLSEKQFVWMPVHPWQMKYVIPKVFEKELRERIIVPIVSNLGKFIPSSSARSLIPIHNRSVHVKVPLGIYSLGALRIMPPRYLENGAKGQQAIENLQSREPELFQQLWVCDETKWLTFFDPEEDLFADKPGHLGCLIREYPEELKEVDMALPMSALSVYSPEGKSPIIQRLLEQSNKIDAKEFFYDISKAFIDLCFMFARYGVLPELHGQNVVLAFQKGQLQHFLLRDHDTVRIYPEWMKREELPIIPYTVKPNTRNTLILSSSEDFISYFQTLAIQVNLASILETFVKGGYFSEEEGWDLIGKAIKQSISEIIPIEIQSELNKILFESNYWPVKEIITPLLYRVGSGGGSMPSGQGKITNPLRWELD